MWQKFFCANTEYGSNNGAMFDWLDTVVVVVGAAATTVANKNFFFTFLIHNKIDKNTFIKECNKNVLT